MNDIYSVLNQVSGKQIEKQPRLSKEEFASQMKAKRDALYELSKNQSDEIVKNPQNYLNYLDIQARLDYTVTNTLLIMAQKPDAVMLKDSTHWKENNMYIKKGEKGIQILEPKGEYERADGTFGTNYAMKYVFDISQMNGQFQMNKPRYTTQTILSGLTLDSAVSLVNNDALGDQSVQYIPSSKTIYYKSGLTENELLNGLIREFCYVEFENQYGEVNMQRDSFFIESSAYLLCSKLGVQVHDVSFANHVQENFNGMDTKEIKKELSDMKELSDDIFKRVERGIYKEQQSKDVKKHQEVR
ncbi:hypothetical protein NSA25_12790 [Erysipelatoclostridium ramosum]|uniref:hypothetical protein n=1 Tax=Thomasclavelia ramosa TaxID=1547 RepID=UPI00192C5FF3|nr:hypothetical protein [Thomasclavelia ramosa]MCR1948715.1 hypothetical protein [Thomasclavelia ramosa]QQY26162.1 hypothetical protein I6I63_08635 [Thomasclavelia ramosa]